MSLMFKRFYYNFLISSKFDYIKSAFFLLLLYLSSIIGFLKFFMVAHFSDPSIFGKYLSIFGILTFIGSIISFGNIETTIKSYTIKWNSNQYLEIDSSFKNLFSSMLIRSIVVILIYFLFILIFAKYYEISILLFCFVIIFTQSVSQLFTSIFRSVNNIKIFSFSQLFRASLTLTLVTLSSIFNSWEGLIIAESISSVLVFIFYYHLMKKQFTSEGYFFRISFRDLLDKLSYKNFFYGFNVSGFYIYLTTIAVSIPLYWDKYFISLFNNYKIVGIYGTTFLIIQIGQLINNILAQKAGPDFIRNHQQINFPNPIRKLLFWIMVGFILQILVLVIGIVSIYLGFIELYLPKYDINLKLFLIAGIASLFQFNGLTEFFLISFGREKEMFFGSLYYFFLFVLGFLIVGFTKLDLSVYFFVLLVSKIIQLGYHFYSIKKLQNI